MNEVLKLSQDSLVNVAGSASWESNIAVPRNHPPRPYLYYYFHEGGHVLEYQAFFRQNNNVITPKEIPDHLIKFSPRRRDALTELLIANQVVTSDSQYELRKVGDEALAAVTKGTFDPSTIRFHDLSGESFEQVLEQSDLSQSGIIRQGDRLIAGVDNKTIAVEVPAFYTEMLCAKLLQESLGIKDRATIPLRSFPSLPTHRAAFFSALQDYILRDVAPIAA